MRSILIVLCMGVVGCGTDDVTPAPPSDTEGTLISAASGGVVRLGEDVTLTIPPGSLAKDTVIGVVTDTANVADADGFLAAGPAFRFSPAGLQFSLQKPAILTMTYDAAALAAQGLDGRTLQLAYFDEELGRYFAIGGEADPTTGRITAKVEHFTLYVAMAASLVAGNNAPTIAMQSPIPSTVRANAPLYLRATVRDYDVGGSVASARLYYRTAATSDFVSVRMTPEATLDTYAALLPASAIVANPSGPDVEYYVGASDNLGATRTTTNLGIELTRTYSAGTLVLAPSTPAIAAGFERVFTVQGRDETNALFSLVPETASAPGIGSTRIGTAGVTFHAETVGVGSVQVGFSSETASLPVTVFNGALERVEILDENGNAFTGTQVIKEGDHVQLDALGYDAHGNSILVTPTWSWSPSIGRVNSSVLDALDGVGSGSVTATVGEVTGTQWFYVQPRAFATSGIIGGGLPAALPRLASKGSTTYLAYMDGSTPRVAHRAAGGTWIDDGPPAPSHVDASAIAIAASPNRVQVAWYNGATLHSAHLEGTTWVHDGGDLTIDPATTNPLGYQPHAIDLAFDGDMPYLASWESNAAGSNVFVRYWNGSGWIYVGGAVDGSGSANQDPSIAIDTDGTIYVALTRVANGAEVFVYRWTGSAWQIVGDELGFIGGQPALSPVIEIIGGRPTVAFLEPIIPGHYDLHVRQWDGMQWNTLMHGIRNEYEVRDHELAGDGDVPYLVWTEIGNTFSHLTRRVAHYNAATNYWAALGTWSHNMSNDGQACALTITDGVPFTAYRDDFGGGYVPVRVLALE